MALINSKDSRRVIPPHEPESWFDVRPIRAGDFEGLQSNGSQVSISLDLLHSLVVSWSYPDALSRENIACLDLDTFTWLSQEIMTLSGIRDAGEKKDSANGSSPPSDPDEDDSPTSSPTS